MTDETPSGRSGLRTVALLAGTGIGVLQLNGVYAAESAADAPANRDALEQVTVFGQKDAHRCTAVNQHDFRARDAGPRRHGS
jgi:hypothetical protein